MEMATQFMIKIFLISYLNCGKATQILSTVHFGTGAPTII